MPDGAALHGLPGRSVALQRRQDAGINQATCRQIAPRRPCKLAVAGGRESVWFAAASRAQPGEYVGEYSMW